MRDVYLVFRVGKQIVNIPSFIVRVDSEKHIDFSVTSPFGGGRPGRVKRRSLKYGFQIFYTLITAFADPRKVEAMVMMTVKIRTVLLIEVVVCLNGTLFKQNTFQLRSSRSKFNIQGSSPR